MLFTNTNALSNVTLKPKFTNEHKTHPLKEEDGLSRWIRSAGSKLMRLNFSVNCFFCSPFKGLGVLVGEV